MVLGDFSVGEALSTDGGALVEDASASFDAPKGRNDGDATKPNGSASTRDGGLPEAADGEATLGARDGDSSVGTADAFVDSSAPPDACPPSSPTLCLGSCVDEQTSPTACGGCGAGYACGAGLACLAGQCVGPGLTLSPTQYVFGTLAVGASSAPRPFVVSNTGAGPSASLATSLGGANASEFTLAADGCVGHVVAAGASCTISVQFAPKARGAKSASLDVNGGQLTAALTGSAQDTVALTVTKSGTGGGTVSGDRIACGATCSEQVTRTSTIDPTVVLTAAPDATSVFSGWSGACSGTSPTCSVTMSQAQAVTAKFDVQLVTLTFMARVFGPASGSVVSSPAGINCTAPCTQSASFAAGTTVTLTAAGGFPVWWGGQPGCSGTTCSMTMGAAQTLTVTFVGNNFVFATSTQHDGALGGPTGADALCNGAAAAAGLPGHYIAWVATQTSNPATRLGTARGWLRTDGLPFADTLAGLAIGRVYYPARLDELGHPTSSFFALTGANEDGTAVANSSGVLNCSDFTSNSNAAMSYYAFGDLNGGSVAWASTGFDVTYCGSQGALLCFGSDSSRPVTVTPAAGRRAFVSKNVFTSGGGLASADAICQSDATSAGLANASHFLALMATNTTSALSRFDMTKAAWVRIDGLPIVSKATDLVSAPLMSSVSQYADGTYVTSVVAAFTGSESPATIDGTGVTCNNWTSTSATDSAIVGYAVTTSSEWFDRVTLNGSGICTTPASVYCFEN